MKSIDAQLEQPAPAWAQERMCEQAAEIAHLRRQVELLTQIVKLEFAKCKLRRAAETGK